MFNPCCFGENYELRTTNDELNFEVRALDVQPRSSSCERRAANSTPNE